LDGLESPCWDLTFQAERTTAKMNNLTSEIFSAKNLCEDWKTRALNADGILERLKELHQLSFSHNTGLRRSNMSIRASVRRYIQRHIAASGSVQNQIDELNHRLAITSGDNGEIMDLDDHSARIQDLKQDVRRHVDRQSELSREHTVTVEDQRMDAEEKPSELRTEFEHQKGRARQLDTRLEQLSEAHSGCSATIQGLETQAESGADTIAMLNGQISGLEADKEQLRVSRERAATVQDQQMTNATARIDAFWICRARLLVALHRAIFDRPVDDAVETGLVTKEWATSAPLAMLRSGPRHLLFGRRCQCSTGDGAGNERDTAAIRHGVERNKQRSLFFSDNDPRPY
jgi:chromosome segregation ATPase